MKLAAVYLTLGIGLAQSGLEPPRAGYYRDAEGALRPLYGVAGSFVPGKLKLAGVLGCASSDAGVLLKLADRVEWRDTELRLVEQWPAPEGAAQFSFTGPKTALAWFVSSGLTVRYELSGAHETAAPARRLRGAGRATAPLERVWAAVEESGLADRVGRNSPIEQIGAGLWGVGGQLAVRLDGPAAGVWRIPQAAAASPLELMTMPDRTVRPPGNAIDLGTAPTFSRRTFLFRVTNTSVAPIRLESIAISGVGFVILDPPGLPATLVSRGYVEFTVEFWPQMTGTFSATLTVNTDSYLLVAQAAGTAGAVILQWKGQTLQDGATVDFSNSATQQFALVNDGDGPATTQQITVTGAGFHGPSGVTAPVTVPAHQEIPFQVTFTPAAAPCCQGTLTVDGLHEKLKAAVVPAFHIVVDPPALRSSQQANVSLQFTSASPVTASGLLKLGFQNGKGDTTLCFLSSETRTAPFEIRAGEDRARFGEASSIGFQTGTTAETLLLLATVGAQTDQWSAQIGPERVGIESVRLTSGPSSVSVAITGFDNTRSASAATFTFYDAQNRALGSGLLQADVAAAFSGFFTNSTMGGAFVLRAMFPVVGQVSSIASVDVTLANSAGNANGHGTMTE